jgi:hypothetical protein
MLLSIYFRTKCIHACVIHSRDLVYNSVNRILNICGEKVEDETMSALFLALSSFVILSNVLNPIRAKLYWLRSKLNFQQIQNFSVLGISMATK